MHMLLLFGKYILIDGRASCGVWDWIAKPRWFEGELEHCHFRTSLTFLEKGARGLSVLLLVPKMVMDVFRLGETSDRKSNYVNQSQPEFFLQGSQYVDVRIGEVNCGGFQLGLFGHYRVHICLSNADAFLIVRSQ